MKYHRCTTMRTFSPALRYSWRGELPPLLLTVNPPLKLPYLTPVSTILSFCKFTQKRSCINMSIKMKMCVNIFVQLVIVANFCHQFLLMKFDNNFHTISWRLNLQDDLFIREFKIHDKFVYDHRVQKYFYIQSYILTIIIWLLTIQTWKGNKRFYFFFAFVNDISLFKKIFQKHRKTVIQTNEN